jgi:hypothetical protein
MAICDDVAGHAAAIHSVPKLAETQALRALVHDAQGHTPEALGALREALRLGLPGGLIRTFVDMGAPVERLLRGLVTLPAADRLRAAPLAEYVYKLMRVFPLQFSSAYSLYANFLMRLSCDFLADAPGTSKIYTPGG